MEAKPRTVVKRKTVCVESNSGACVVDIGNMYMC